MGSKQALCLLVNPKRIRPLPPTTRPAYSLQSQMLRASGAMPFALAQLLRHTASCSNIYYSSGKREGRVVVECRGTLYSPRTVANAHLVHSAGDDEDC